MLTHLTNIILCITGSYIFISLFTSFPTNKWRRNVSLLSFSFFFIQTKEDYYFSLVFSIFIVFTPFLSFKQTEVSACLDSNKNPHSHVLILFYHDFKKLENGASQSPCGEWWHPRNKSFQTHIKTKIEMVIHRLTGRIEI